MLWKYRLAIVGARLHLSDLFFMFYCRFIMQMWKYPTHIFWVLYTISSEILKSERSFSRSVLMSVFVSD